MNFINQIITWLIAATSWTALLLGIWLIWERVLWDFLMRNILKTLSLHRKFIAFILHYRAFKEYLKKRHEDEDWVKNDNKKPGALIYTGKTTTKLTADGNLVNNQ